MINECAEFQPVFEKSQCEQSLCDSSSQFSNLLYQGELKGIRQHSHKNMFELLLESYTMKALCIDDSILSFIIEKIKEHIFTIQFLSANSSPRGTPH